MSRIGKLPIHIPQGVTVAVSPDNTVTVKGPKGQLSQQVSADLTVTVEENEVHVACHTGMNKSDKIHPIITLIFYYGESPWDGPVTLSGMMTDIPEELRPLFSDYKINLVQILDSGHYQFYNEDVRSVFDITQKIYTKNLQ